MSQSPREPEDVDPATAPSPNDDEQPQPNSENNDQNDMSRTADDVGYDFEVKEQDRWLPIANGE